MSILSNGNLVAGFYDNDFKLILYSKDNGSILSYIDLQTYIYTTSSYENYVLVGGKE